jgi:hypothetical protein
VFEEVGGVEAVQSSSELASSVSCSQQPDVFVRRVHEIVSHGYETRPDTKVLRTVWSSRREPHALAQVNGLAGLNSLSLSFFYVLHIPAWVLSTGVFRWLSKRNSC